MEEFCWCPCGCNASSQSWILRPSGLCEPCEDNVSHEVAPKPHHKKWVTQLKIVLSYLERMGRLEE